MLTKNEIIAQHDAGNIVITPWDPASLGPNSYDVRLAPELMIYKEIVLDAKRDNRTKTYTIPEEGLVLKPGILYLGKTVEYTESYDLIPMYEGRSSVGRLGIYSHVTAGFGDIGFKGNWTLEISVVQPVRVYPNMRIGQLYWHKPEGEIQGNTYQGKYQGSRDIVASRMWRDRENEKGES